MRITTTVCSLLTALAVCVGGWLGIDMIASPSNSTVPVFQPETVTDMISSFVSVNESPTNTPSSNPSSVVSSKPSPSSVVSSKTPSKVTSSKVSSTVKPPVQEPVKVGIVNFLKRPSYRSVQKEIAALEEKYPQLIQVSSIGESVQGRDLTLLQVGKGKTKACIVAGIHARESITVSYTLRCVEEFCRAYESKTGKFAGFDMKNLLDNYTLYIVPLSNPDGLEIINGRDTPEVKVTYREKMTIQDYKANANGVNLNKNFPLLWKQINNKVTTPDPEGYKGEAAGSEPETKALMKLCNNNNFVWMTSIHVRGDCVYWSDATNPSVGASEKIVNILKERCDFYKCETSKEVNGYGGGFENWFRNEFQRPGLCLELMPLDIKVTPTTNSNHASFNNTVRWDVTKKVLPLIMVYGFVK